MRHKVYGRKLGRSKDERSALFKNLLKSLILHGSIKTTEAKAKAIKGLVDKEINQAKKENDRKFIPISRLKSRTSGYTSLVKLGLRQGDGAMMVRLNLLMDEKKEAKK